MADGVITAGQAASYLVAYVERYREEHEQLVKPPPDGGGFPTIVESPFLSSRVVNCLLANDGAVVFDVSDEPPNEWHVAGGPALMVDYPDPDSRVPPAIVERLRREGIYGKGIGIYRVCFREPVADEVWTGSIPEPIERVTVKAPSGPTVEVSRVEIAWATLIERLTYGAFGGIFDLGLPTTQDDFWQPTIVRDLGFTTADREQRRFFHYLDLSRHLDTAAWDERGAWARAKIDVRRDLSHAIAIAEQRGGQFRLAHKLIHASRSKLRHCGIGSAPLNRRLRVLSDCWMNSRMPSKRCFRSI